jgi:glycosyltransferase involved in cell wall biosynthesis
LIPHPVKGVEILLQAFEKVKRQRSHVRLLFIGGKIDLKVEEGEGASYFEKMERLSEQLGVDDKIIWTGAFKAEDEKASLFLRAADIGVLPFLHGVQLNNSSLSTMAAHDLPIIATRGSGLDEQFIHGENMLLCGSGDVPALAQSITLMIDHPDLRDRLRSGVQKLSQEWFCWDQAITRTLATFGMKSHHELS